MKNLFLIVLVGVSLGTMCLNPTFSFSRPCETVLTELT